MQVNINVTNSYIAKSVAGPSTGYQYTNGFAFSILPQVPTDPQVNEIWVYRRGNTLADWRRVLVFDSTNWTLPQVDGLTDVLAAQRSGWDLNLADVRDIGEIRIQLTEANVKLEFIKEQLSDIKKTQ